MSAQTEQPDLNALNDIFSSTDVASRLRDAAPQLHEAAARFWNAAMRSEHLSARMKELILLALHASATANNGEAIKRHVLRARQAGASDADVVDVLQTIVVLSNHAVYFAIPVLMKELAAAGREDELELPPPRADIVENKKEFIKTRGFWLEAREPVSRLMPDYYLGLSELSIATAKHGALSPKEREFIYIAIDCSVTHTYEQGLGNHIRQALKHGATRAEILTVYQLAGVMGMEGYFLGVEALLGPAVA